MKPARLVALAAAGLLALPVAPASAAARSCSWSRVLTVGKPSDGKQAYGQYKVRICYPGISPVETEYGVEEIGTTDFAQLASATIATTITSKERRGPTVVVHTANFSAKEYLVASIGGQSWYPDLVIKPGVKYTVKVTFTVDLALDRSGAKSVSTGYSFYG